jgi:acetyl-CoA synthetase
MDAIRKPSEWRVPPNLTDYEAVRRRFSWENVRRELGAVNIGSLAVDRHAKSTNPAIRWLGRNGARRDFSYPELQRETARFANLLSSFGIQPGERIFALTPRIPELYVAALGALKYRAVFCPLFAAFGPEPLFQRMSRGDARVLVTTERLYRKNVEPIRPRLPKLEHVLLTGDTAEDATNGVRSLNRALERMADSYEAPETSPEDMALLHFTSGTTGMPKGAIHVHEAALMHYITARYALDLRPDDVFWCTADPGWVTGTSYGILAPLMHGVTNLVDEGEFDAMRWYETLEREKVNVWYTAPTAIRMMMRLAVKPKDTYDLSALRFIASVGEPLNPSAVRWGEEAFGMPIHDNWWQTETGGITIANFRSMEVRPGSMGRSMPGVEAGLVRRVPGGVEEIGETGVEGELALRPGWPSMFRGYLHEEERYRKCFAGGWYLTGDLVQRDSDGYYFFVGRADDIIKTAGHMVGPFEVESVLMEHPAVAEAGVIGKPDPVIGEMVKAFVVLKAGFEPTEDLRLELIGFARKRMGSATAPKEIAFEKSLPRTRSGKTMRRLLKNREVGLPEGDTSTLEAV